MTARSFAELLNPIPNAAAALRAADAAARDQALAAGGQNGEVQLAGWGRRYYHHHHHHHHRFFRFFRHHHHHHHHFYRY